MTTAIHQSICPGLSRSLYLQTLQRGAYGIALAFALTGTTVFANIIGTNPPAQPLTDQRVATLPKKEQGAWKDYLKRSDRQRQVDQEFLRKELRRLGAKQLTIPPEGRGRRWL